jgi:enoyl-CoA hydratase/carnithine racemase
MLKRLPIITLCAVNGVAAAAGFQMALTCDLIVATEKSTFSTPGVKWGLFCSTPGVQLVRSINSEKKANEMLLFGEPITAQEAFSYGLINKVVPNDKLEEEVSSYIAKANKLSGEVIGLGKRVLSQQSCLDLEQAYNVAIEGMRENIMEKEDCR